MTGGLYLKKLRENMKKFDNFYLSEMLINIHISEHYQEKMFLEVIKIPGILR